MTPAQPTEPGQAPSLLEMLASGRYREAARLAQGAPTDPPDPVGLVALYKAGRFDEVARRLDDHPQALADNPRLRFLRGLVDWDRRNYAGALHHWDGLNPDDPELQARLEHCRGLAHYWRGEYHDAAELFGQMVRHRDDDIGAWHNLALAAAAEGRTDEATAAVARCIELDESRASYYVGFLRRIGAAESRRETGSQIHRFKNLLSILGADYRQLAAVHPELSALQAGVRRQEKLVADMSRYLSSMAPGEVEFSVVHLGDLLEDIRLGLVATWPDVAMAVELPESDLVIVADRPALHEALLNLATNAAEATAGRGRITVTVTADDQVVRLRLCDSGPGVTREAAGRIFSPGFSTKPFGSGFGLVQARRALERVGGSLSVDLLVDAGACFVMVHPRLPDFSNDTLAPAPLGAQREEMTWLLDWTH